MALPSSPNLSRWRAGLWSGCWIALLATTLGCASANPIDLATDSSPTASPPSEEVADSGAREPEVSLETTPQEGTALAPGETEVGEVDLDLEGDQPDVSGTDGGDRIAQDQGDGAEADDLAQHLPITAKTILGGEEIFLEVAATPAQQALGLMYRDALPDDRGMVFPMNRPRPVRFWMMNVPVPLDMLFVHQGEIQYIAAEVPPCPVAPCPTYGPDSQLIDHVIELRAGRAAELGLQVGDAVEILPLE